MSAEIKHGTKSSVLEYISATFGYCQGPSRSLQLKSPSYRARSNLYLYNIYSALTSATGLNSPAAGSSFFPFVAAVPNFLLIFIPPVASSVLLTLSLADRDAGCVNLQSADHQHSRDHANSRLVHRSPYRHAFPPRASSRGPSMRDFDVMTTSISPSSPSDTADVVTWTFFASLDAFAADSAGGGIGLPSASS